MAAPLHIMVYNYLFQPQGTIGDAETVEVTPFWLDAGEAVITIRSNHQRVGALMAEGSRVWIKDAEGEHILSGWVEVLDAAGPETQSLFTFTVTDDFTMFKDVLGWVDPTSAIGAQGQAGTSWKMTGPAETVILEALAVNARDRLGLDLTVHAGAGRGATIDASLRMESLYDYFFTEEGLDLTKQSDFGIGIRQRDSGGLETYTWEPRTIPQTLSEASGVVREWSYNASRATATRVVVGGAGDGALRVWREKVIPERETGRVIEAWSDASGAFEPEDLYAAADTALSEGAPKAGFSIAFNETAHFQYQRSFNVGDTVNLEVGGITLTDRLTAATLTWTADGGFSATPQVGDKTDDHDVTLLSAVQRITRSIRSRNARR